MKKFAFILDDDLPDYGDKHFCQKIGGCGFQRQSEDGVTCTLANQDFGDEIDQAGNICEFVSSTKPSSADLR